MARLRGHAVIFMKTHRPLGCCSGRYRIAFTLEVTDGLLLAANTDVRSPLAGMTANTHALARAIR